MAKPLIVANWKAEGTLAGLPGYIAAIDAAQITAAAEIVICPPAPLLVPLQAAIGGLPIGIGAQNCRSEREAGASGNPGAALLAEVGCRYVLAGHADRRTLGDNDEILQSKLAAIAAAGLLPIFCVSDGDELLSRQLMLLTGLSFSRIVIAYEPMWAIGSGKTPAPDAIDAQLNLIRQRAAKIIPNTRMTALYGGSVMPENAGAIMGLPSCGGLLVGKAAYTAAGLVAIAANSCRAAADTL